MVANVEPSNSFSKPTRDPRGRLRGPNTVASEGITITGSFMIPENELQWKFGPSGGPGGQHANRAHTRVELRWAVASSAGPDEQQRKRLHDQLGDPVLVVVNDERSQARNRDLARNRLADRIRAALHEDRQRRPTRPTLGSKRRRLDDKRRRSSIKRGRARPTGDD